MLDRMKRAFGVTAPSRPQARPTLEMVPVPIVRANDAIGDRPADQLGYLDRSGERSANGFRQQPVLFSTLPLRTADADVRMAWPAVSASVRHLVQNSGWLSGAIDQFVGYAIGQGLTPNIEPEHELLDWKPDFAKQWARQVERLFDDWAYILKSLPA